MKLKKFVFARNLLYFLSSSDNKELITYYNELSNKGFHLVKPGFSTEMYEENYSVIYNYVNVAFYDNEFAFYNHSDNWELLYHNRNSYYFRKEVGKMIVHKMHFPSSQLDSEKSWLDEHSIKGDILVSIATGEYVFEDTLSDLPIEYKIDYKIKTDDFLQYINRYKQFGWYYVCSFEGRHYFANAKSLSTDTLSKTILKEEEKNRIIANKKVYGAIVLLIIMVFIANSMISILRNEHSYDENTRLFVSAGYFWLVVLCVLFMKNIIDIYKCKRKARNPTIISEVNINKENEVDKEYLRKQILLNIGLLLFSVFLLAGSIYAIITWLVRKQDISFVMQILVFPLACISICMVFSFLKEIVLMIKNGNK